MDISALKKLALNFINFHNVELPHWHSPQMQVDGDRIGFIPDESHELWLAYQAGFAEAQRWIPVGERLPETFKDVLVLSNGAISINKHVTGYRHGGIWAGGNRDEDITHWMPLPAQPAGDQQ